LDKKAFEIMERRISNIEYNSFLSNPNRHCSTNIVPKTISEKWIQGEKPYLHQKTDAITELLTPILGSPFFCAPGFILYHGDCLDIMQKLADLNFFVELTITSPPYNIGKEYEQHLSCEQYMNWCSQWMTAIHSITSATGTFWLNLGYFEVPGKGLCVPISYLLWDKSPFYFQQEIVWNYGAGVSTQKRLCPRNEKWLYFIKNADHYTFNLDDIRDPNVKYPNQKKNGKFRCHPLGKNPSDVWSFPKVTTGNKRSSKERTVHPAQFPLAVVERIVLVSSNPGDIVLDPFAGSCSTGIACHGLDRIFIGFEIQQKYCELSVERFQRYIEERTIHESQKMLFS